MSEDLKNGAAPVPADEGHSYQATTDGTSTGSQKDHVPSIGGGSEAVKFLRWFRPEGPWILTAIVPDGRITTWTFWPGKEDTLTEWLSTKEGRSNIYFTVNWTGDGNLTKKPKKEKILRAEWLHVDVDPAKGEERDVARRRILNSLEKFAPRPTCVIDSGNGYQAFWRLTEAVTVDKPSEEAWAEFERTNRWIAEQLGGDSCHNVDRIMRLPGTINVPNAKKAREGRGKKPASAVWFDQNGPSFSLDEFGKADREETEVAALARGVEAADDYDFDALPERVRAAANEGWMPGGHQEDDRSKVVLFCVAECIREKVPDEIIKAMLLDHDLRVGRHVHDQKAPDRYADRQIARARAKVENQVDETTIDDPLGWISERYFGAIVGGRSRFFEDRLPLEAMNREAITDVLRPIKIPVDTGKKDPVWKPAFPFWLESPRRRFYRRGFILDPASEHTEDHYNMWRGYGVEPAPGDPEPMLGHIREVVEPDAQEYLINWMAWVVRNPADKPRVAVVLRGDEGTGKGFICSTLVKMFGVHGSQMTQKKHIVGSFNAHMQHCCLMFADEVQFRPGEEEGVLKTMITEPTMPLEGKGVDVREVDSYLAMIMSTNQDWAVPASVGARRFVVADVNSTRKGDAEHFERLFAWRDKEGGLAALLHHLLDEHEIPAGWHPEKDRVKTQALAEQEAASMDPLDRVLFNILWEGTGPERLSTSWLIECSERLGKTINAMNVYHRFRRYPSWQKCNQAPKGWLCPSDLQKARLEFRPDATWPDDGQLTLDLSRTEIDLDDIPF